jgi:2-C-methyl-D-erythritol 2,4-cyclodiphosphate synthase
VRIGIGYDVHRLVAGRPLILGGVVLDAPLGLDGHSDADVLTHAVIDALLGAAALGDIGTHFPDSDERWRGADSLALLRSVVSTVAHEGWAVSNVDATLILERPRLRPFVDAMRANLAAALGVEPGCVSVKATTGEKMGFVGREEGAAAHAVALLVPRAERGGP